MKPGKIHHVVGGGAVAVLFDPFAERDGPTGPPVEGGHIDSWPVENQNTMTYYMLNAGGYGLGQTFTGKAGTLGSMKFSLNRATAGGVGLIHAELRPAAGMIPLAGTILATSDPVPESSIGQGATETAGVLYEFLFPTPFELIEGDPYCAIVMSDPDCMQIQVGQTNPSPGGHPGALSYTDPGGSWLPAPIPDLVFYVYAK